MPGNWRIARPQPTFGLAVGSHREYTCFIFHVSKPRRISQGMHALGTELPLEFMKLPSSTSTSRELTFPVKARRRLHSLHCQTVVEQHSERSFNINLSSVRRKQRGAFRLGRTTVILQEAEPANCIPEPIDRAHAASLNVPNTPASPSKSAPNCVAHEVLK